MKSLVFIFLYILLFSTYPKVENAPLGENTIKPNSQKSLFQNKYARYDSLFKKHPNYISVKFDFPVGKPDAHGYYNAQKFQKNHHLGDDWNGNGGGNSDLGDPIYAIANGYVSFAQDVRGDWGKVIRIIHQFKGNYYESLYAHCQEINITKGTFVKRGMQIASIGNADGAYLAHLHLELRNDIFMDLGPGYSKNITGYLDPTTFIKNN